MTKKKRRKRPAFKRKVKLPCDRTGMPVHIGDLLQWDDGTRMQVGSLTYYGGDGWTAEDDGGDFTDNIGAAIVVWRGKEDE